MAELNEKQLFKELSGGGMAIKIIIKHVWFIQTLSFQSNPDGVVFLFS